MHDVSSHTCALPKCTVTAVAASPDRHVRPRVICMCVLLVQLRSVTCIDKADTRSISHALPCWWGLLLIASQYLASAGTGKNHHDYYSYYQSTHGAGQAILTRQLQDHDPSALGRSAGAGSRH